MTEAKATTANPKDLFGNKKVSLSKLPPIAVAHGAMAMMDGAEKYGAYNWRDKKVIASIYVDAAKRHIDNWFEGQEVAKDSLVHHLGHAIACCAILLDAQETGNLIDDRPIGGDPDVLDRALDRMADAIAIRRAMREKAIKDANPIVVVTTAGEVCEAPTLDEANASLERARRGMCDCQARMDRCDGSCVGLATKTVV